MELIPKLLNDKNIILTGCNRGIGEKTLEQLAKNGANVWACTRKISQEDITKYDTLENSFHIKIWPITLDLSNSESINEAIKEIRKFKLPIDGLINNAGITYNALFQMSSISMIKEVFEINLFSQILFTQFVLKLMLRNNSGSIVNISSTAGIDANLGRSIYGASKAAMICITKAIAREVGEKGIRINSIAPGITQTDMIKSMSNEIIEETRQLTQLKRLGEPIDIANVCVFLLSELSSYLTGQVIRVDGGLKI
jgi:3-oxoacyl-[acyl-carrier protein] reductase